jgi:hypothetical protein
MTGFIEIFLNSFLTSTTVCFQLVALFLFAPLESPAIYGGDNIIKASIPCRKGGVKASSFLTGFTLSAQIIE